MARGKKKDAKAKEPPPGERQAAAGPEHDEAHRQHNEQARRDAIHETAETVISLDEQISGIRAKRAKAIDRLKKEFGISKGAFSAALMLYRMDDTTARNTLVQDQIACMQALDLLDPEIPLFAKAGVAAPKSDVPLNEKPPRAQKAAEDPTSATVQGRKAFENGELFATCPYKGSSMGQKVNREAWERGWMSAEESWVRERDKARHAGDGGSADDEQGEAAPPANQAGHADQLAAE